MSRTLVLRRRDIEIGLAALGVMIGLAVLWQNCGLRECPDVAGLNRRQPNQSSVILDVQGRELARLFLERRTMVSLDELPLSVPSAFVAMEDRRFWSHRGVDWPRVLGAGWRNIQELGVAEGASTITMQLARNLFAGDLPATRRTILRKLEEARVAIEIERTFTKRQILGMYLNQIYFGSGAYGIETAAQEYFGKPATALTLAEAATLATIPKGPARLNPRDDPAASLAGRRVVLSRMAAQGMITAEQAQAAGAEALALRQGTLRSLERAPYFVDAVRLLLEDAVGIGVFSDGYTIRTTLDLTLQTAVEEELANQLLAIESGAYGRFAHPTYAAAKRTGAVDQGGTTYLQAAAVFMDAQSGDIRALVGGRDHADSQFNRATQAMRQPGSAFKPFVYAAAVAAGYPPSYRLTDQPLRLALGGGRVWEPQNYDRAYGGEVTMREALTSSNNVATVRLGMEVGVERVVRMARRIGLKGSLASVPSVLLGSAEVTPMAMTSAYSTFATLGENAQPRLITSVTDRDGVVVWSRPSVSVRVLTPAVAYIVTSMLEDVVDRGTGTAVRAAGFAGAAAGKTGTTDDAADVWFVGYTPRTVGTIWMGFDQPQTVVPGATGGALAAPVWGRVMLRAGPTSGDWWMPDGVVTRLVDEDGDVFGEHCPAMSGTRAELFLTGVGSITSCNSTPLLSEEPPSELQPIERPPTDPQPTDPSTDTVPR